MSKFEWKVLEMWNIPGGPAVFGDCENIMNIDDMLNMDSSSRLTKFIDFAKSLGINGICVWGESVHPEASGAFSSYLKKKGIGYFVWRNWNHYERGDIIWPPDVSMSKFTKPSKKYCPFNKDLEDYWKYRTAKDFKDYPGLAGYNVTCLEKYHFKGTPWQCDCEKCKSLSVRERGIAGINLIARSLKPHNGLLFWQTVQDDAFSMKNEVEIFRDLDGLVEENVRITVKETYWDYQPGFPKHALFYTMDKNKKAGKSIYLTSIQLTGEYKGVHSAIWSLVDKWSEDFREMEKNNQENLWIMATVHPDTFDHPLNLVNWYAISQLIENPKKDPDQIMLDWASIKYGKENANTIVGIIRKMTTATKKILFYKGLWTSNHSRFPALDYLDSHVCGPYKEVKKVEGMIGLDLPLDMYPPEIAKNIKEDSESFPIFNKVKLNRELKTDILNEKEEAIEIANECIDMLKGIKDTLEPDIYKDLLNRLTGNRNDAIFWLIGMKLYLDWKLGILNKSNLKNIDEEIEKARGLKGSMLVDPLEEPPGITGWGVSYTATLKSFANELKEEINNPKLAIELQKQQTTGISKY